MEITYRNGHQMIRVTYSDDCESCEIDTVGLRPEDEDYLIEAAVMAQGRDFEGFTAEIC